MAAAAAAMGEGEATRQKSKKKRKPKHVELGAAPSLLPAAPFPQTPTQSTAPGTPILEEAATEAAMRKRKRKMRKEQKAALAAPPLAQKPTLEEEEAVLATTTKKKKKRKSSPSPSTSAAAASAAETPILEQEQKVTKNKKRERSKDQEPSGYSPVPLDHGQAESQGTKAPHASKLLPAAPFLEAPARSPASGTSMSEEAAMRKMKMCKAQDTTLEEQREDGMSAKMKKKNKESKHTLSSPSTAETPIWEQEAKVTKKLKHTPLPLDPGQAQAQGTNVPHASKRLPAAPFLEAPAPGTPLLEEPVVTAVMRNRKICKERKVAALSLAQNTALEEQREDGMLAKMNKKDSKHMEAEVIKKQKQRKQQEPSGKSPLPPDLGQTHRVRSQGGKAPPEQEQKADGRKGSCIENNNGTRPRVRVLSKRELIREGSKKPPALPEGFVPFSDFVASCTEQNPDHSSPHIAFFDQFRYNPVRKGHKPPIPRTPDRLAARKSKKKDSGSGSASGSKEKLNAEEKKNPEKKREPLPLLTRAEMCSDKYRRVPLDKLVQPPRSPHHLLQENYASDPWKVIVICMLLNLTQGKQVKKIVEGFFECYPDPHAAINADPEKMGDYLTPLGLQHTKTTRIQTFSKQYVENDWNYITELCGVGKYAADAYAIFCAGRATEVVPKDHKLVAYWKYVCFGLPRAQGSQGVQEAGVTGQELAVIC